ncbi:MAG: hypothetical protein ABIR96_04070 [Bdellovibrionota bacterium]
MKIENVFLLTVLLLTLGACDSMGTYGGTDVGNPDIKTSSSVGPELSQAACNTLNFCFSGFDRAACQTASLEIDGVAPLIGAPESQNLADIDEAISSNRSDIIPQNLRSCLQRVMSLRCTEVPLDQIWNRNESSNYRGLTIFWAAVRNDCSNVVRARP